MRTRTSAQARTTLIMKKWRKRTIRIQIWLNASTASSMLVVLPWESKQHLVPSKSRVHLGTFWYLLLLHGVHRTTCTGCFSCSRQSPVQWKPRVTISANIWAQGKKGYSCTLPASEYSLYWEQNRGIKAPRRMEINWETKLSISFGWWSLHRSRPRVFAVF